MNVFSGILAFECKWFPNEAVMKFKILFFCLWWSTAWRDCFVWELCICFPMDQSLACAFFENLVNLRSKQADDTSAFHYANLGEDKKLFNQPNFGFKIWNSNWKCKVVCLKRSLYCLHEIFEPFWIISLKILEMLSTSRSVQLLIPGNC